MVLDYSRVIKKHQESLANPVKVEEIKTVETNEEIVVREYDFRRTQVLVTGMDKTVPYRSWMNTILEHSYDDDFINQCRISVKKVSEVRNVSEYDILFLCFNSDSSLMKVKRLLNRVRTGLVVFCGFRFFSGEILEKLIEKETVIYVTSQTMFEPITYIQTIYGVEYTSEPAESVTVDENDVYSSDYSSEEE